MDQRNTKVYSYVSNIFLEDVIYENKSDNVRLIQVWYNYF